MNFLAHLLLSYPDSDEMTGNFMGDFFKGKSYEVLPIEVRRGVLLHRAIDDFTDHHEEVKSLIQDVKPIYKRYSGVVTDVLFDYLLARDFSQFSELSLSEFSNHVYCVIHDKHEILPERVAYILERMKETRRLEQYASLSGLRNSLELMVQYTSLPDYLDLFFYYIQSNERFINMVFNSFYPALQSFVKEQRLVLNYKYV